MLRAARDVSDNGAVGSPRRARRFQYHTMHIFGDPKLHFSNDSPDSAESKAMVTPIGPLSRVEINVPPIEVSQSEGIDVVEIPDGDIVIEIGEAIVPSYSVQHLLPAGTVVQDVVLESRSNPTATNGLTLLIAELAISADATTAPEQAESAPDSFFPETAFEWAVTPNDDGSTLLQITAHAFRYDHTSGQGLFYSNFVFNVETVQSDVTVQRIHTNRRTFILGDRVDIDLYILNQGQAMNLFVTSEITQTENGEQQNVNSRTMTDAAGLCSYAYNWTLPDTMQPGEYSIKTTVRDTQQQLVASDSHTFEIRAADAELTDLSVNPPGFSFGDSIQVSATIHGKGPGPASGQVRSGHFPHTGRPGAGARNPLPPLYQSCRRGHHGIDRRLAEQ